MPINASLAKRLPMPTVFVTVNFNDGVLHSFPSYNFASRGAIRLVRNGADPFIVLYRLGKFHGSRAKCLGRFGRFPTMDYDPNQCWGEFTTWEEEQEFIPKGRHTRPKYRHKPVRLDPLPQQVEYRTETPLEDGFAPETPTRFSFYVDRRELLVRPVLITGRSEDGQVRYDWPAFGSWCRHGVDDEQFFHGAAEWAMDQLLEFMAAQGNLGPWIKEEEDEQQRN